MSSKQAEARGPREPARQLRECVLEQCSDLDLVETYTSFQRRMKAERNACAGGHIDGEQLQRNLQQLRKEKAACAMRIEDSIRQNTLHRVAQDGAALVPLNAFRSGGLRTGSQTPAHSGRILPRAL